MNSKYPAFLFVIVCLSLTVLLTSCGGVSASNDSGNPSATVAIAAVTPATATLAPGATQQFQTAVTGASNTAVVWQVNGVAGGAASSGTISASGLYTAPATISQSTQFTITAMAAADNSKTAKASVTVNPASSSQVIGVAISPASASVTTNATRQFSATVSGSSDQSVTWSVDGSNGGNATVGSISVAGLYTAPSVAGTHTITATSVADNTKNAKATVTVNAASAVVVSPASAAIAVSTTQQFTASISGNSNTTFTWSVDGVSGGNASLGTISASGLYTAPATAGTHSITATSASNQAQSGSGSVAVVSLTLSPTSATVVPDGTRQFTANLQDAGNDSVSWSVDGVANGNTTVGTISASGLYTAPDSVGNHTVTAISAEIPTLSANSSVSVANSTPGAVSVLTYHNDDVRDGVNSSETVLNLSNVNSQQFGKKYSYSVDGQIYAQPLYVPNLTISGSSHNVVYVETENDTIYAFDADGGSSSPLWQNHLGLAPNNSNDKGGIVPILGITSTPVIDPTTNTIYVLTDTEESGRVYRLHALDLITGAEKFGGSVVVDGSVLGTGVDSVGGRITLEKGCYQRMGLALDPVTSDIYIAFGHCAHGWVLAYNKTTLQQTAIMNTTPDGAGGALWGGGGAPAIDTNGDLYLITGCDENDPASGYNDSAQRLSSLDLSLIDYFKPADDPYLREEDLDYGSGAGLIMPDNSSSTPHEFIGAGKDGRIFVINRDNMGQYQSTDHVIQVIQSGVQTYDNFYDTPAYWNGYLYLHAQNDVIRAFSWDSSTGLLSASPIAQGTATYGKRGATASISSNGSSDGIVWEIEATDYDQGPAVLHAYNATNVSQELYNSSQAADGRDTAGTAVRFSVPTIADGHVFVGTGTELDIYGLLSQP